MKTRILVGLMMLVVGGCARDATVAQAPVAVAAPANEEDCMLVAERAYEVAAGYEMSALGDAPVPDAAYEDAYARCVERPEDIEHHRIAAGLDEAEFKIQLAELIEDVGCGDPIASKREADGSTSYAFSCLTEAR
jgi:hypothetical protein